MVVDEACLLPGTRVMTERGYLPVEEVKVGDSVVNQNGDVTRVKNVWSKPYSGECVRVKPAGWAEGWCLTSDHRVLSAPSVFPYSYRNVRHVGDFDWRDAGELDRDSWTMVPIIKGSSAASSVAVGSS